jgi:hypothetical protein
MDRRYPAQRPALVRIRAGLGDWAQDASEARGAPEWPLGDNALEAKFLDSAGTALGTERTAELLAGLWRIDRASDVSALLGIASGLRA